MTGPGDPSSQFPDGVPKGLTYNDLGHQLNFSWRWFSKSDWFIAFFAVFWNLIMLVVFASGAPLIALSLHLLAGLFVGFHALRQAVNRTSVELRPGVLAVTSGPLMGKEDIIARPFDLKQLYVRRRSTGSVNGNPTYVFEVHALIGNYDDVKVAGNVPTLEQAHFIEAQIERYLEIPDNEVQGSIPRPRQREEPFPVIQQEIGGAQSTRGELRDAVSEASDAPVAGDWGGEVINPEQA